MGPAAQAARKAAERATSSRHGRSNHQPSGISPAMPTQAGHLTHGTSDLRERWQSPGDDAEMPGKKESKADKETPEQAEAPEDSSQPVAATEQGAEARPEAPPQPDEKVVLLRRNEELLSRMMYLQAEFENYQKRALRERQDIVANAQEGLLRSLLPILDDFDKAVEIAGEGDSGLKLLHAKLLKILEESGLVEIPAKGQKFDPFIHDAVEFVNEEDAEHGTIKEVIRKGYRCNTKVLRPSLVIVVKNEGEKNA